MDGQQIRRAHRNLAPHHAQLVRTLHPLVKNFHRHRHQIGMRHPRSVVPRAYFAQLVRRNRRECLFVHRRVLATGDGGRHTAHGERAAAVAGLDQKIRVRLEERLAHDDLATVGQHIFGFCPQGLDEGEDVVPAAAVQPNNVVLQFEQNLVHFEGGRERFDQYRDFHGACRQT